MSRDDMIALLSERLGLNAAQFELNRRVKVLSEGLAHNQGCPLGGLRTGMAADVSGSECWCGASEYVRGLER